ncbi:hypothetical protein SAMN02745134_01505 [Clostridium acidisoli DSM 12555]|uniref:Uncharacterized protein n=1 Tax=Clostridium acidisoli DSM 12555 TaxID=1121291 RepID=A0A1W1XDM8_9CLOT|nr:hypothetical protein [Clostridium acidisoli]SMC21987.1 hypothetical protein SAMN02745134_01505 [Clostridium acidisoli DSM 12555]
MQLNDTDKMAMIIVDYLEKNLGDKIGSCNIFNVVDDKNYRAFSIRFEAYDYFIVLFNYDRGLIGCSIQYGDNNFIGLKNSQKWYEKADFDVFCKELQQQLELRIPDKFLEANSWK